MSKPVQKPKCKLVGENGNIFNLIGIASKCLKSHGQIMQANEMTRRITKDGEAKSYDEALCIIMEYVDAY